MLASMKEMLLKAQKGQYAVPHFNVWNVEMLEGVMDAVEEGKSPVIISFGTGFVKNTDPDHFAPMMVSMARAATVPASVHWDHGRNFGIVQHAVDIGFTSVMIDASANPLDVNIRLTKEVVDAFQHRATPSRPSWAMSAPRRNMKMRSPATGTRIPTRPGSSSRPRARTPWPSRSETCMASTVPNRRSISEFWNGCARRSTRHWCCTEPRE